MSAQDEYDDLVRKGERERIAKHIRTVASEMLRDPVADAIDGYTAAVMLNLSDVIETNGNGALPEFWKPAARG